MRTKTRVFSPEHRAKLSAAKKGKVHSPETRAKIGGSPVRAESEGSTVQVVAGYSPDEYRLLGKIRGPAPFSGVLVHHGWKTDAVNLPRVLRSSTDRLPAIAPAEVELS